MVIRYTPFNINDHVRVRLTEYGRNILYHDNLRLNALVKEQNPSADDIPLKINEDEQGWSSWQLWSLMARFGPSMNLVSPMPFASDIEFEVRE